MNEGNRFNAGEYQQEALRIAAVGIKHLQPGELLLQAVRCGCVQQHTTLNKLAKILGISLNYATDILCGRRTGDKANERLIELRQLSAPISLKENN